MKEIYTALIQFQGACPAIEKDSEVEVTTRSGHKYKFSYATFGNIVRTIKEPLSKSGLGYTFLTLENKFICRVIHTSGESLDTALDLPKFRESMQENGSILTYLKRYSLVLALGLNTDQDDDANSAEGNEASFKKGPYIPKETVKNIDSFIEKKGSEIKNYTCKVGKFKGKKLAEIDYLEIQTYLTWLHNSAKEKNQSLTGDWLEFAKIAEAYISQDL